MSFNISQNRNVLGELKLKRKFTVPLYWTAKAVIAASSNKLNKLYTDKIGTWIAVGDGGYYVVSKDNGNSWAAPAQITSWTGNINDVSGNGTGVIIMVGDDGQYAKSTDNGVTFSSKMTISDWTTEEIYSVCNNESTTWMVGGEGGCWSKSTDNGVNWTNKIAGALSSTQTSCVYGNGVWISVGEAVIGELKIHYSIDNGANWINSSVGNALFNNNCISTDGKGTWIIGNGSGVSCLSKDDGLSWTNISLGINPYYIESDGDGVWIAVGEGGYISISLDNGSTWLGSPVILSGWSGIDVMSVKTDRVGNWVAEGGATTSCYSRRDWKNIKILT